MASAALLRRSATMGRHISLIFILQRMLNGRPEIHGKGTDLNLHLEPRRALNRLYGIIDDQMIAPVTAFLHVREIIFLTLDRHIFPVAMMRGNFRDVLLKRQIIRIPQCPLSLLPVSPWKCFCRCIFSRMLGNTFHPPGHFLNGRILVVGDIPQSNVQILIINSCTASS